MSATRAAAAQQKAKADLEKQVTEARESAQGQAEKLRKSADETKGGLSAWWANVGRSWNDHLDAVRDAENGRGIDKCRPIRVDAADDSRKSRPERVGYHLVAKRIDSQRGCRVEAKICQ